MNSNPQLNENYKFRFAYVLNIFKDMVSASEEIEDKELNNRIDKVVKAQDNEYLQGLEKEMETHEVSKKRKSTRNSAKEGIIKEAVKENASLGNNEVVLDEEKDR